MDKKSHINLRKLFTIHKLPIIYNQIKFVKSESIRNLYCSLPYPDHPHGCPNYDSKKTKQNHLCPPYSPFLKDKLREFSYFTLVYGIFDFGQYLILRKNIYPNWSDKQIRNCLHYQNAIKSYLIHYVRSITPSGSLILGCGGERITKCASMESVGINVLGMYQKLGIDFETKPKTKIVFCTLICHNIPLIKQKTLLEK